MLSSVFLVFFSANLSNDYFTNRQDRCIVFEDSKELCDYFHNLVKTVSSVSLELKPDCSTEVSANCSEHPYQGNKDRYIEIVKDKLKCFMQKYQNYRKLDYSLKERDHLSPSEQNDLVTREGKKASDKSEGVSTETDELEGDTFIIPTLQMFYYGVRQDEIFTSRFLESAPSNSDVFLATAYFNVTNQHWNEILTTKSKNFDVVMAHPMANGFYKAPGPAGKQLMTILQFIFASLKLSGER